MASKTYAALTAAVDVQDADLLASFRPAGGPLKSLTALLHFTYIQTKLGLGALATLNTITASLISDPTNVKTTESLIIAISDEVTAITTGTAKMTVYLPYAITLTEAFIGNTTASSSGAPQVDVKQNGTTIFTTKPSIGSGQNTSRTGTGSVPAVLNITSLASSDKITVDITAAGTGAAGLKLYLVFHRT